MIATLEEAGTLPAGVFSTIGDWLQRPEARKATLEDQITFGLHAQRYCRALGLCVVRLPGLPPRYPAEALEHVQRARYDHWLQSAPALSDEIATLAADLLDGRPETGPVTFEELESFCIARGHLARLFSRSDTPQARYARIGSAMRKHEGKRLPNQTILHIKHNTNRRRLYHFTQL